MSPTHDGRPLVELICDAGPRIGLGHLRRCLTLTPALVAQGCRVRLRCLGPASVHEPLPDAEGEADVLVVDLPEHHEDELRTALTRGAPVLALDYFGPQTPTLTISIRERGPGRSRHRRAGLEYALIRPDLGPPGRCEDAGRGVLVSLGGADVLGRSMAIATGLAARGLEVSVVLGPYAALGSPRADGVEVLRSPEDFPARLRRAAWVVSNGGGTMLEALYCARPTWVVPQTEAEEALAAVVAAQAGILGIGPEPSFPALDAARDIARRGAGLIDGRGAERIAQAVRELM